MVPFCSLSRFIIIYCILGVSQDKYTLNTYDSICKSLHYVSILHNACNYFTFLESGLYVEVQRFHSLGINPYLTSAFVVE